MKFFYPVLLLPLLAGCPFAKCGDNKTNKDEACDDGNTNDADGCEADCSLPACANDIIDPGELCFGEPVNFATDSAPTEPAVADLNNDGHQDLITANSIGNSVSVLLGDGTGSFTRQTDIEFNSPAFFIVAGDFNGDQLPDFAASLSDADTIEVFKGFGDGTFEPLVAVASNDADNLLVADFNDDGDLDLASSFADGVALFLSDGAGGFEAPRISFIGSNAALSTADFDGDGDLDLAAGVGGALVLLLGDGIGNFAPQPPQLDGEIQGNFAAGDFNGDQLTDLATAQFSNGSVNILTNQAGTFTQAQTFSTASPFALAAADLNQDGSPDLAVASDLDANLNAHLVTITSDANVFVAQEPLLTGNGNLRGITTSDLNEDTVPDVILTDTNANQLTLFLSQP